MAGTPESAAALKALAEEFNNMRPTVLEAGRYCKTKEHGRLGVHKSGIVLMCGHPRCNYQEPVSTAQVGQ